VCSDGMFFSIHSFAILTAKFSASPFSCEPLLRHGQIDVPLGGTGRLGDGCHSRPVAVGHLLGRDGDVVAAVGRDYLSPNYGVTSLEIDPDSTST
jgi:hypothetical protein